MQYFKHVAKQFETLNVEAYKWAFAKDPRHWCKSHWRKVVCSDISMNNHCESFNGFILAARNRAIISLLECIRNLLMKRIMKKRIEIGKCGGPLCPETQQKFEKIKKEANGFIITWNGGSLYQVRGPWGEQMTVSLTARTCSCGSWELTGIPCKHTVAAIYEYGKNGGNGVAEEWVHEYYTKSMQEKIYEHCINPINGVSMWEEQSLIPIVAPKVRIQPGRPRKCRRRAAEEGPKPSKDTGVKTRVMTCKRCGNTGHNLRSCKGQKATVDQSSRVKKKGKFSQEHLSHNGLDSGATVGSSGSGSIHTTGGIGVILDGSQSQSTHMARGKGIGLTGRGRGRGMTTRGRGLIGASLEAGASVEANLSQTSQPLRKSPRKLKKKTYVDI